MIIIIDIEHPIFWGQATIDCEVGFDRPDRDVGITGGWNILEFEVIEINGKKYSDKILRSVKAWLCNNFLDYEGQMQTEVDSQMYQRQIEKLEYYRR